MLIIRIMQNSKNTYISININNDVGLTAANLEKYYDFYSFNEFNFHQLKGKAKQNLKMFFTLKKKFDS